MWDCLYQIMKDFQTIIVGLLGFSGVIVTLRMNAHLSQKQHERSVEHNRKVLRTALSAELELIRKSFSDKASLTEENGEFHPLKSRTDIYQNFVGKLGLLSVEQASSVIEAYTLIDETSVRLQLLSYGHDPSYNKPGYIYIMDNQSKKASGIYKNFLPSIEAALEKLKGKDLL